MRILRVISSALLLILSMASSFAAVTVPSVEVKKDDLTFRLSLEKTQYLNGEPIIATITLVNDSDKARFLVEPSIGYNIAYVSVKQISGSSKPTLPTAVGATMGAPPNYCWEFKPGEAHSGDCDIQFKFSKLLPVGTYEASASYFADAYITSLRPDVWRGRMSTGALKFSVVTPGPADAKATAEFKRGMTYFRKYASHKEMALYGAQSFASLKDPKIGRGYARYAGYFAAECYLIAGLPESGLAAYREYIKSNSNTPYYGRLALKQLALRLRCNGSYAEARELFNKLPDGFDKAQWIKECDELIAAQQKAK